MYSLQDLIDVNSGSLLPFLTKIHSLFLTHIKSDCQVRTQNTSSYITQASVAVGSAVWRRSGLHA